MHACTNPSRSFPGDCTSTSRKANPAAHQGPHGDRRTGWITGSAGWLWLGQPGAQEGRIPSLPPPPPPDPYPSRVTAFTGKHASACCRKQTAPRLLKMVTGTQLAWSSPPPMSYYPLLRGISTKTHTANQQTYYSTQVSNVGRVEPTRD
jgi:hypothetical protein